MPNRHKKQFLIQQSGMLAIAGIVVDLMLIFIMVMYKHVLMLYSAFNNPYLKS
jgi:hypothetical protein